MFGKRWLAPLAGSAVLALSVISSGWAGELSKAPEASTPLAGTAPAPIWLGANPPFTCNAWVVTNYYSDATHTTKVGQCSITCRQYDQGSAYPLFNSGGACTGVSSAFTADLTTVCPCIP